MMHEVVWGIRRELGDLARFVDAPPLHVVMLAEARDALDAWLALLVTDDPVPESELNEAKDLALGHLSSLAYLVDFREAHDVAHWLQTLARAGATVTGLPVGGSE
jgi:hypothetical protein